MLKPSALINFWRQDAQHPPRRWAATALVAYAVRFGRRGAALLRRRWYWAAMILALLAVDFWLITNNTLFRGMPASQPVVLEPVGRVEIPGTPQVQPAGQTPGQAPADEVMSTLTGEPVSLRFPLRGDILRMFGFTFNPLYQDYRLHAGIDLSASGGTPVAAALDGQVTQVESSELFRFRVTIDHGAGWQTRYAQLDQVRVQKGQKVQAGETLGLVGAPGLEEQQDDTHLHFELRRQGQAVDPLPYLVP